MTTTPISLVILVSGNGSNLQALIDAIAENRLAAKISLVISNRPEAFALERAQQANIPVHTINHLLYPDRQTFDQEMIRHIDACNPDLVVLAGFMRLLTDAFVQHYHEKMINIHPSLLPKHKGLNTHQRVIDSGELWHGASVHFVVPELDSGPCIAQVRIPVIKTDTPEALASRLLTQEHQLYPFAINLIAQRRIRWHENQIFLDGKKLEAPMEMPAIT